MKLERVRLKVLQFPGLLCSVSVILEEGHLKDKFAFSRLIKVVHLRGENCLQNTHFYKSKTPCFKRPLNWPGSVFPLLIKVLQFPGLLCSVHLKVLQFPGLLCKSAAFSRLFVRCALKSAAISRRGCPKRGVSQAADPLDSDYIKQIPQIFLCNRPPTITY